MTQGYSISFGISYMLPPAAVVDSFSSILASSWWPTDAAAKGHVFLLLSIAKMLAPILAKAIATTFLP